MNIFLFPQKTKVAKFKDNIFRILNYLMLSQLQKVCFVGFYPLKSLEIGNCFAVFF